jgi:hypothetical protein
MMAAPLFKAALAKADGDLGEIVALTSFLGSTMKVVAESGGIAAYVGQDATLRRVIADFRKDKIDDLNVLYQGLYIQVFSTYEAFVRNLIAEFVDEVARRDKTLANLALREGFVDRHTYQTGVALQQLVSKRANVALDYGKLAENLASVSANSALITLNAVAFTLQLNALNAEGLQRALKRIGVNEKSLWTDLAKEPKLQTHYNSQKTKEVAKRLQGDLNEIVKRRNHIAHKGDAIQAISEADVRELIRFFGALYPSLVSIALAAF